MNTLGLENCNEELNSEYTSIKCVYKPDKENYLKENLRFSFVLGGFSHEIPFYSIFASENKNVTKEGKSAELLIRFATNDDQVWIFGQLFLSLFSTVFDKDNKIISFYGGNKSNFTDEVREWENKIYQFQANRMKHLSWLIICFLGILFLIFVLFMCYRILKRRRLIGSDDIRPLVNIINNN